ncbi:MAG: response regulator [Nitrospirae bacterium]|nr:response regulator [Candidatus Manganitrophaceae bacterium]
MRVLIVEDDERILGFLKRGLEAEQHEIETAPTGEIGLDLAKTHSYDVLLLDIYLPGISGLDLCRKLRLQGLATPILIMTARDAPHVQDEGRRAGANDYLAKPFSFELLLEKIEALRPCGERSS